MTVVAGATIGPYRIIEQIGRGGMATVYKAYQAALARNVAIKVLPAFFAEDAGFRERFQQEAIAIAKLRHPNILAVFDYGEENGVTYIVSEFVDGGTLAEQVGSALPTDYAARILGPIASALDYAHARGILHRDVKPSNVLLARDGTPILSDFGLAKMVGSMPRLTQSGTTVGTPEYMAPEQAMGEDVGPGADLYALAVIAYEMLTGRVPYSAETPLAVLLAHVHKPLPLPRSVNPSLSAAVEGVLLKGLAKTAGERYPTATELVHALSEAARGVAPAAAGSVAPPVTFMPPAVTPAPSPIASPAARVASEPAAPAVAPGTAPPRTGLSRVPLPAWILLGVALVGFFAIGLARELGPAARPAGAAPTAAAALPPGASGAVPAQATPAVQGTPPTGTGPSGGSSERKPAKGELVWKATFAQGELETSPAYPDATAASLRRGTDAVELVVNKAGGGIGLFFHQFPPERFFMEWDLQLNGESIDAMITLRSGRAGGHLIRLMTARETVQIQEQTCQANTCDMRPASAPHVLQGMRTGKRFTLGAVAGPSGYVVFVDGEQVAAAQVNAVGEAALQINVFGQREGTVGIYGVRVYQLRLS